LTSSDITERLGPLISIDASAGAGAFAIERDLVTCAAVRLWLHRTGSPRPARFVDGRDDEPAVGLSPLEAAAFAAAVGLRLPTVEEWAIAAAGAGQGVGFSLMGARGFCRLWEWTSTSMRTGYVVCGGVPRNHAGALASVAHRSWEDQGAVDVGFRCAISGEATHV
jgi:hypothetical protein